jgi:dTMP kinase
MRKYPGYFITFEGGEGSGKTCQLRYLANYFQELGLPVVSTREPGGTSISEQIRGVLHDLKNTEMHPRAETLLYQAARAQIVEQLVVPNLKEGKIVMSDRFFDSTLAYQGYGHRQDLGEITLLVRYATGGLIPDLSVFFDVDVETGLNRRNGTTEWNRIDAYEHDFHQRVRQGYLELMKMEPDRWVSVDANKNRDEVYCELGRKIENRLALNGFIERRRFGPER